MDLRATQARTTAIGAPRRPAAASLPSHRSDARSIGAPVIALGLLLFAAVWLGELAYTSLSPPVDNIEQLTWVRSLEGGYYKHPPLPTWLIWLPVRLFGASAATSYALGAACTLGAVLIFWRLLTRLRGTTYATVALLAALCITYYNDRLFYYNHNVVLLLMSSAAAALCWQAFTTRQLRWWAALGFVLGLAALSKYQAVVTLVSVLVFALRQRAWRDPVHRCGLWLAGLTALLVFAPHIEWLRKHDFGPIDYALGTSLGARLSLWARSIESLHWLVDQVFNRLFPALLLLGSLGFGLRRGRRAAPRHDPSIPFAGDGNARAFLLIWGLVPLLFMPLIGLASGADLQLQWGTAFLLFAVPAAMEFAPPGFWNKTDLAKALRLFCLIQALLLGLNHATSPRGVVWLRDHHWTTFDSGQLAQLIGSAARTELGGPVAVVSGGIAEAGALALQLPEHPLVLIDGRFDRSPWVDPELAAQCGVLELGRSAALLGGRPVGADFPGLSWRVTKRDAAATACAGRTR